MPYKFFDNLLESKSGGKTKRKLTLPVSIGIHVSCWGRPARSAAHVQRTTRARHEQRHPAYLVEAARRRRPAATTSSPAASAPKTVTTPKVEQPKPVVEEPKFTAPIEIPKELPKPEPATGLDSGPGEPGGEIGGVQGGVKGGTQGGVVGGTIGGVPAASWAASWRRPWRNREGRASPRRPERTRRVGGKIKAPSKLNNVPPAYRNGEAARVEGTVILEATISPTAA
jgi:hypothetical protein